MMHLSKCGDDDNDNKQQHTQIKHTNNWRLDDERQNLAKL